MITTAQTLTAPPGAPGPPRAVLSALPRESGFRSRWSPGRFAQLRLLSAQKRFRRRSIPRPPRAVLSALPREFGFRSRWSPGRFAQLRLLSAQERFRRRSIPLPLVAGSLRSTSVAIGAKAVSTALDSAPVGRRVASLNFGCYRRKNGFVGACSSKLRAFLISRFRINI